MNILTLYIKGLADGKDISTRNRRKFIKGVGFRTVLKRGCILKKDDCGTILVKNMTDVLRDLVECRGIDDIMFSLELGTLYRELLSQAIRRSTFEYVTKKRG